MFRRTRIRFTLLYTLTSGMILCVVIAVALFSMEKQEEGRRQERFSDVFYSLTANLRYESRFAYSQLSKIENENQMLIYMEDGGSPFDFRKKENNQGMRKECIDRIKLMAQKDGVDMNNRPASTSMMTSPIYNFRLPEGFACSGAISLVVFEQSYRGLVLGQLYQPNKGAAARQMFLFVLSGGLGIIVLCLMGWKLSGAILHPIEESRKRQTEFVAAASHELRSPITVIQTNASAIRMAPEEADRFAEGIERECMRMSGLIGDMLLLASADAKTWRMEKTPMDVDTQILDVYELFDTYCLNHGFSLVLQLPDEALTRINGDKDRLKQILAALIDNAVVHSHAVEDRRISLKVYEVKKYVCIEVADYGEGIPIDQKREVFHRFYQGDKSRKDKKHFGLGLSIVEELVGLMGGRILCEDTPGGGCTFCIFLRK